MFDVYFFKFKKRENSTARPSIEDGRLFRCTLKENTSLNTPGFLLDFDDPNSWPDYSFAYVPVWNKYFYVNDWINEKPLWRASCSIDVLATYKDEILDSTQYVSYSSVSGGSWLVDDRIPVLRNASVATAAADLGVFDRNGCYTMTVIGRHGTAMYAMDASTLSAIIASISNGADDFVKQAKDRADQFLTGGTAPLSAEDMLGFATLSTQNDILGNAYGNAPSCIRSCIWVPVSPSRIPDLGGYAQGRVWLGNFDTQRSAKPISARPITGTSGVSIPWQHSGWRRSYCEQVYIYLPLVGMVALSSDDLAEQPSITINWSLTAADGAIAYQLLSGGEIIGSYGGSCAINYPLGVNQQASAGQIMNAIIGGLTSTVSSAIHADPIGVAGGVIGTMYSAASTALTSHPSCVGGIGGGAGTGLDLNVTCYTVSHETVIEPGAMQQTMGLPTMQPLKLSQCSGYCQCANAHVSANASLEELNAITTHLNSGFFIE